MLAPTKMKFVMEPNGPVGYAPTDLSRLSDDLHDLIKECRALLQLRDQVLAVHLRNTRVDFEGLSACLDQELLFRAVILCTSYQVLIAHCRQEIDTRVATLESLLQHLVAETGAANRIQVSQQRLSNLAAAQLTLKSVEAFRQIADHSTPLTAKLASPLSYQHLVAAARHKGSKFRQSLWKQTTHQRFARPIGLEIDAHSQQLITASDALTEMANRLITAWIALQQGVSRLDEKSFYDKLEQLVRAGSDTRPLLERQDQDRSYVGSLMLEAIEARRALGTACLDLDRALERNDTGIAAQSFHAVSNEDSKPKLLRACCDLYVCQALVEARSASASLDNYLRSSEWKGVEKQITDSQWRTFELIKECSAVQVAANNPKI